MMNNSSAFTIDEPTAGVVRIYFNRPQVLNALTLAMATELNETLKRLAADKTCRVIIIGGHGRAFCAGLDVASNAKAQAEDPSLQLKLTIQSSFSALPKQIRACPQPVIVALQGAAVGVGLAMALAADIRLGSESLKCLIGSVKLGLSAGESGISYHLPRLVGASRAFEIMLTGRAVLADEALNIGLLSGCVEDDKLADEAVNLAQQLMANSPYALESTKALMWANLEASSLDDAIALENNTQVVGSMTEDFIEAGKAFTEKRAPKFTGR